MSNLAAHKGAVRETISRSADDLLHVSHTISANPELSMEEYAASALLVDAVKNLTGIVTSTGFGGLETAFQAEAGTGDLVIAICAEYDALPTVGHGCGHNIIATAALGAFVALAPLADELGTTVRLMGTPAEENGGGKVKLIDAGAFDDVHAAIMVHPAPSDVVSMNPYASNGIKVRFSGRESHASLSPHEGINALDALTVALTATGLARQQLEPGQQIHTSISEAGGAPNVIPGSASAMWMVRGSTLESLDRVTQVVERCVRAGALAAACEVSIEKKTKGMYSDILIDEELINLYEKNALELGRAPAPIPPLGGSTDMGNVSHVVPSIHPMIGLGMPELTLHTAEFAAAAAGPAGDQAALDGAILLAQTAIDFALIPSLRTRLQSDDPLAKRTPHL